MTITEVLYILRYLIWMIGGAYTMLLLTVLIIYLVDRHKYK